MMYSKSVQLGKTVNPKKKKRDGSTLSRVDDWNRERPKLKKIYADKNITSCEYLSKKNVPCHSKLALGFAHDDNRDNLEPGDLGSFKHTLLLCQDHHHLIENDKKETARLFKSLRNV